MADLRLVANFTPESGSVAALQKQVQSYFTGNPIKVTFDTGSVGAATAKISNAFSTSTKLTGRRIRQESINFSNIQRQAEDYYAANQKGIQKNTALSKEWQTALTKIGDKSQWSDSTEARQYFKTLQAESRAAGVEVETLGQRIKRLFGQHFDTALVMLGINALRQGLKELWTDVKEVNTVLTQFQIVSRMSNSDLNAFANDAFASAKKISASFTSVVDAATVYKRLGYSTEDSLNFAELTTMYSKVGDVPIADAESNITAMVKAFNLSSEDLQGALDKMVYVGNNFPISAQQLGEGLNNAASSLAVGGNSLEESMALLTSAMTTTQDVSKASTGLRTISARIRNTGVELEDLGETLDDSYNTIPKYREQLLALSGVDILDDMGEFRSTYDIIKDLSDVWGDLKSKEQAAITTMVAGVRQQNVFASLLQEFGEAEKIMSTIDDSGGAMSDAYGTYSASIEAAINRIDTAFQKLSSDTLDSDFASGFLDAGTGILNILDQMVTKLGLIPTLAGGVGAVLGFNNQGIIGKNGNSNEYALHLQAA